MSFTDYLSDEQKKHLFKNAQEQPVENTAAMQQPKNSLGQAVNSSIDNVYANNSALEALVGKENIAYPDQQVQQNNDSLFTGFTKGTGAGITGVVSGLGGVGQLIAGTDGSIVKGIDNFSQENFGRKREWGFNDIANDPFGWLSDPYGASYAAGNLVGSGIAMAGLGAAVSAAAPASVTSGATAALIGTASKLYKISGGKLGLSAEAAAQALNTPAGKLILDSYIGKFIEAGSEGGSAGREKLAESGDIAEARKTLAINTAENLAYLVGTGAFGSATMLSALGNAGAGKYVKSGVNVALDSLGQGLDEGFQQSFTEHSQGKIPFSNVVNPMAWSPEAKAQFLETALINPFVAGGKAVGGTVLNKAVGTNQNEQETEQQSNANDNKQTVSNNEQPTQASKEYRPAIISGDIEDKNLANTVPEAVNGVHALNSWAYENFGKDIVVSGGWRSEENNRAVNGHPNSHHLYGQAVDMDLSNFTPEERSAIEQQAKSMGFRTLYHDAGTGEHLHVAVDDGTKLNTGVYTQPTVDGRTADYSPTVDEYLNSMLQGDNASVNALDAMNPQAQMFNEALQNSTRAAEPQQAATVPVEQTDEYIALAAELEELQKQEATQKAKLESLKGKTDKKSTDAAGKIESKIEKLSDKIKKTQNALNFYKTKYNGANKIADVGRRVARQDKNSTVIKDRERERMNVAAQENRNAQVNDAIDALQNENNVAQARDIRTDFATEPFMPVSKANKGMQRLADAERVATGKPTRTETYAADVDRTREQKRAKEEKVRTVNSLLNKGKEKIATAKQDKLDREWYMAEHEKNMKGYANADEVRNSNNPNVKRASESKSLRDITRNAMGGDHASQVAFNRLGKEVKAYLMQREIDRLERENALENQLAETPDKATEPFMPEGYHRLAKEGRGGEYEGRREKIEAKRNAAKEKAAAEEKAAEEKATAEKTAKRKLISDMVEKARKNIEQQKQKALDYEWLAMEHEKNMKGFANADEVRNSNSPSVKKAADSKALEAMTRKAMSGNKVSQRAFAKMSPAVKAFLMQREIDRINKENIFENQKETTPDRATKPFMPEAYLKLQREGRSDEYEKVQAKVAKNAEGKTSNSTKDVVAERDAAEAKAVDDTRKELTEANQKDKELKAQEKLQQAVEKVDENRLELNASSFEDPESQEYLRQALKKRFKKFFGKNDNELDKLVDDLIARQGDILKELRNIISPDSVMAEWQNRDINGVMSVEFKGQTLNIRYRKNSEAKLGSGKNAYIMKNQVIRSAFKKNGEYELNIDLGTLCTKREPIDTLINVLNNMEGELINNLGVTQYGALKNILKEEGFLTACDICFVETKRIRALNDANKWSFEWQSVLRALGLDDGTKLGEREQFDKNSDIYKMLERMAGFEHGQAEKYMNAKTDNARKKITNADKRKAISQAAYDELMPDEVKRTKKYKYDKDGNIKLKDDGSIDYGADLDSGITVDKMQKIATLMLQDTSMCGEFGASILLDASGTDWLFRNFADTNVAGTMAGAFGTATAKPLESFNIYDPLSWLKSFDLKAVNQKLYDHLYDIGGFRCQSFTDFNIIQFFDYVQMFADMEARRIPLHMYTKVPSLVEIFGTTGAKINMSLVAKVEEDVDAKHIGLRRATDAEKAAYEKSVKAGTLVDDITNGKVVMVNDEGWTYSWGEESFPVDKAFRYRANENYKGNVGIIAVALSDEHAKMLLADPTIDYVIPFHKSGMPAATQRKTGLDNATDYTDTQTVKTISGKRIRGSKGVYVVKSTMDQYKDSNGKPKYNSFNHILRTEKDPRQAAAKYIEMCKDARLVPIFEQFAYEYVERDGKKYVQYDDGRELQVKWDGNNKRFGAVVDVLADENGKPILDKKGGTTDVLVPILSQGNPKLNSEYFKVLEDFRTLQNDNKTYSEQGAVRMTLDEKWQDHVKQALDERTETVDKPLQQLREGTLKSKRAQEYERLANSSNPEDKAKAKAYEKHKNETVADRATDALKRERLELDARETMVNGLQRALGKENITCLRQSKFYDALEKEYEKETDAERAKAKVEVFRTGRGIVYGFAKNGKIYLNEDHFNAATPAHEFTHVWVKVVKSTPEGKKFWANAIETLKDTETWAQVVKDATEGDNPIYGNIAGNEDAIASEVLSRIVGDTNEQFISIITNPKNKLTKAEGMKLALARALGNDTSADSEKVASLAELIKEFFNRVKDAFENLRYRYFTGDTKAFSEQPLKLEELIRMPLAAIFDEAEGNAFKSAMAIAEMDEQTANVGETETTRESAELSAETFKTVDDVRKKYEGTDKWMKAPNGKKTKLSEKQWLQVRTDNFKKWFGDWENDPENASKVVDDNGEPLVTYHGTPIAEFEEFNTGLIYTVSDKHVAAFYSNDDETIVGKKDSYTDTQIAKKPIQDVLKYIREQTGKDYVKLEEEHLPKAIKKYLGKSSSAKNDAKDRQEWLDNLNGKALEEWQKTIYDATQEFQKLYNKVLTSELTEKEAARMVELEDVVVDAWKDKRVKGKRFAEGAAMRSLHNNNIYVGEDIVISGDGNGYPIEGDSLRIEASRIAKKSARRGLYSFFVNMRNPFEYDAKGENWQGLSLYDITKDKRHMVISTDGVSRWAREQGYDGAIIKNVHDINLEEYYTGDDYVSFKPNQVKSTDDNNGDFSDSGNFYYSATDKETELRFRQEVEAEIKKAFPVAKIIETNQYGTVMEMPNGERFIYNVKDNIILSEKQAKKAAAAHGIDKDSVQAQGLWKKFTQAGVARMLTISRNSERGTAFHEAMHAAIDLALTKKEKDALYNYYQKKADEQGRDVEEVLADAYRDWVLARQQHRGTLFGKLWQKVKDLCTRVQALFDKGAEIERIMQDVESGKVYERGTKGTGLKDRAKVMPLNGDVNLDRMVTVLDLTNAVPKNLLNSKSVTGYLRGIIAKNAVLSDNDSKTIMEILPEKVRHIVYSSQKGINPKDNAIKNIGKLNLINLVKSSVLIESAPNTKKNDKPDVRAYHSFYVPVKVGSRLYTMCIVAEEREGAITVNPTLTNLYDVLIETKNRSVQRLVQDHILVGAGNGLFNISIRDVLSVVKDKKGNPLYIDANGNGIFNTGVDSPFHASVKPQMQRTVSRQEIQSKAEAIVPLKVEKNQRDALHKMYNRKANLGFVHAAGSVGEISGVIGMYVDNVSKLSEKDALKQELLQGAWDRAQDLKQAQKFSTLNEDLKVKEGAAYFGRLYATNRAEAESKFPEYFKAFEKYLNQHKDLKTKTDDYYSAAEAFYKQTPEGRAKAGITQLDDPPKTRREKAKAFLHDFYVNWFDDKDILRRTERKIEALSGKKIKNDDSAYIQARLAGSSIASRVDLLINGAVNQWGKTAAKGSKERKAWFNALNEIYDGAMINDVSYQDIVDKATEVDKKYIEKHNFRDAMEALGSYLLANRFLEIWETKPNYTASMTKAQAEQVVNNAPKALKEAAQLYYDYDANIISILHKEGMISDKAYEGLKKYTRYCPLFRDFTDEAAFDSFMNKISDNGSYINLSNGIKALTEEGSDRTVLDDPTKSMLKMSAAIISKVERNKVAKKFVALGNRSSVGQFVIPALDQKTGEQLQTSNPQESRFTVWENGEKKAYTTLPEIYEVLEGGNAAATAYGDMLTNMVSHKAAAYLRKGATVSIGFIIRNFIRDTISGMMNSKNSFVPFVDSYRGMKLLLTDADFRAKYMASGANMSSYFKQDAEGLQDMLDEMAGNKWWQKTTALEKLKLMWDHYEQFGELIEQGTRAGEFALALKNDKSLLEAAYDAKEITLDFSRAGKSGREMNRKIAFFNAVLQGGDKMVRTAIENPKRTMAVSAKLALATVILWAINHDDDWYKELDSETKYSNWHFHIGDKHLVIPKPQEFGLLTCASVEAALESMYQKDPKPMGQWAKQFVVQMLPSLMPSLYQPIIEAWANYSIHFDSPVVSKKYQNLKEEAQINSNTSELAKGLGKLTGKSPIKIDHLIRGYFGGAGAFVARIPNKILEEGGQPAKYWNEMPVINEFVQNDFDHAKSINEWYELKDKIAKENATNLNAGKGVKGKPPAYVSAANKVSKDLSDIRKTIEKVKQSRLDEATKRNRINLLNARALKIAQMGLKRFSKYVD